MSNYPLTIFHDGSCPVCRLDIANLQARNTDSKLLFIDIAKPGFDPQRYEITLPDFLAEIHAQRPDGSFVKGMEVFRLAYRAVGLGWIVAPASWGFMRGPTNAAYRLFARHRPWISSHFDFAFETLLAWQASRRAKHCRDGVCSISSNQIDHSSH